MHPLEEPREQLVGHATAVRASRGWPTRAPSPRRSPSDEQDAVVATTIRVCSDPRRRAYAARAAARTAPGTRGRRRSTAIAIVRQTTGSPTNRMRLSRIEGEPGVVERRDRVEHTVVGGASPSGSRTRRDSRTASTTAATASKARLIARDADDDPPHVAEPERSWSRPARSAACADRAGATTSRPSSDASVMIPNPPTWIRHEDHRLAEARPVGRRCRRP